MSQVCVDEIFLSNILKNYHTGFAFLLESFLWTGRGPTLYLFFRKQFGWGEQEYGLYTGIFGVLGIIGEQGSAGEMIF